MKRFIKRMFQGALKGQRKSASRCERGIKLSMDELETRLVPAAITDMTVLAQQWPTHDGPTHLYLNFDGYNDGSTVVNKYNGTANIQDIIFRTSEIFAPFNVEVSRMYGQNSYDSNSEGNTTIFIGDMAVNNSTLPGGAVVNGTHSYTPFANSDYPGTTLGGTHAVNSNAYDLAFVDPIGKDARGVDTSLDAIGISQAIAHEAGHTFGLAHVLSSPTNDIMSYNSTNQYFADASFNITNLNFTGTKTVNDPTVVPKYNGTALTTQNSYTFLEQVLGDRPDGDTRHVVHSGSVDSAHYSTPATNLVPNVAKNGTLDREGDFMVYWMKVTRDWTVNVSVTPTAGQLLPDLFVYNNGNLMNFTDSWWNGTTRQYEVHSAQLSLAAGQTYAFVVGSAGGNSTGNFQLKVSGLAYMTPSDLATLTAAEAYVHPSTGSTFLPATLSSAVSRVGSSTTSLTVKPLLLAPAPTPVPGPGPVERLVAVNAIEIEGLALSYAETQSLGNGTSFVAWQNSGIGTDAGVAANAAPADAVASLDAAADPVVSPMADQSQDSAPTASDAATADPAVLAAAEPPVDSSVTPPADPVVDVPATVDNIAQVDPALESPANPTVDPAAIPQDQALGALVVDVSAIPQADPTVDGAVSNAVPADPIVVTALTADAGLVAQADAPVAAGSLAADPAANLQADPMLDAANALATDGGVYAQADPMLDVGAAAAQPLDTSASTDSSSQLVSSDAAWATLATEPAYQAPTSVYQSVAAVPQTSVSLDALATPMPVYSVALRTQL
jgi:hypothetical protein